MLYTKVYSLNFLKRLKNENNQQTYNNPAIAEWYGEFMVLMEVEKKCFMNIPNCLRSGLYLILELEQEEPLHI